MNRYYACKKKSCANYKVVQVVRVDEYGEPLLDYADRCDDCGTPMAATPSPADAAEETAHSAVAMLERAE